MIRKTITTVGIMAMILPVLLTGQIKFGFVEGERIRREYEEFQDADAQLQLEMRQAQARGVTMLTELDSIKQAFETQRLMRNPNYVKEIENDIASREKTIQQYQEQIFGPQGALYQRQMQLEIELMSKVKRAVEKISLVNGLDLMIDRSVALLYGNPLNDYTDEVLNELRKFTAPANQDSVNEK